VTNGDPLAISGQVFGEYIAEGFRGHGAFGWVYNAIHSPSGTLVALKILNPNAGLIQQQEFDNEGALLLKMTGASNVVDLLDSGEEYKEVTLPGGVKLPVRFRYHVLERADDCLDQLLLDVASLDWTSRLHLFRDAVLGVHQMHGRRLAHRDLKAANCLLFKEGRGLKVKIADLGRSRDLRQQPRAPVQAYAFERGDPDFAPPELLWGSGEDVPQNHICADLYGLGSLLYELVLGHGITGIALLGQYNQIRHHRGLSSNESRRRTYRARLPEIRDWYQPAFHVFGQAAPPAIRFHTGSMLRQLCDPDPMKRLPQLAPGKRRQPNNDLCWLLNKVDIVRLTLSNDLKQSQRLRSRKGV
jgi:serine/threonine protein kinase